jgi:hypothetical protein
MRSFSWPCVCVSTVVSVHILIISFSTRSVSHQRKKGLLRTFCLKLAQYARNYVIDNLDELDMSCSCLTNYPNI